MMTFTSSHKNLRGDTESSVSYTIYDEGDLHEVMQEFRKFLLAAGFHPGSVDKYVEAE